MSTSLKLMSFLLLIFAFAPTAKAQVCPLGARDTQLTIQRVMINFGKFTAKADDVVTQGLNDFSSVTEADLVAATQDLAVAQACAMAVVQGGSDDLLPAGAKKLSGTDRDQYVAEFTQAMSMFAQALGDYATSLSEIATATTKDYAAASVQKKRIGQMADEAHGHFSY